MNQSKIGERVRKIRENILKLSREKLAENLDVNIYSLDRLERGEFKILNIDVIIKISKLSSVPIDEIINGSINNKNQNLIRRIDFILQDLSEKELNYIFENLNNYVSFIHPDITTNKSKSKWNELKMFYKIFIIATYFI